MAQVINSRRFLVGSSNVLHSYHKDNSWSTLEILFRWNI